MSALTTVPWETPTTDVVNLQAKVNAAPLAALQDVQTTFEEHAVWARPDGLGGVHVVIDGVHLGPAFMQDASWLGFTINYLYPDADTYPHYVRSDLTHVDGNPLLVPFHIGNQFLEQPAVMVSRSSPNRVSGLSTPSRKALSVVAFIQAQLANREQAA